MTNVTHDKKQLKLLLVGVGLMGGSFSLALGDRKYFEVGGVDVIKKHLDQAVELGIINRKFELDEGMRWADIILLSIPVDQIKEQLPAMLDKVKKDQLIVDFGSTKSLICKAVAAHPNRSNFLAAHPIAGTEHSGPRAAFPTLYQNKNLIICQAHLTDTELKDRFLKIAKKGGFYFTFMGAEEHDRHLAYISHLSHVSSYVLSNTVLKKEKSGEVIPELAGAGFASTVRLAKSSPKMWSAIFLENRERVLEGIKNYKKELEIIERLLEKEDGEGIEHYLEKGREIRSILKS